jgi:hypothetical protein
MRKSAFLPVIAAAILAACHSLMRPVPPPAPPSAKQLAELWVEPQAPRDLFWGVGGERLQPDASAVYKILETKRGGFSMGYTVEDPNGRKWSVKLPPEASTEVVASRILWAVGYHQPPIYYVGRWNAAEADQNPQLPGRFRETKPDLHGMVAGAAWSYYRGPFVGTRELNGLLVLMAMLGNSDLKDEQNVIYHLEQPFEGAAQWYVARDLGQSFGKTGVIDAPRGDVKTFEEAPFIKGMSGNYVRFEWHGRHGVLFDRIVPEDVHWICARLKRITDRQWHDAFRAGGYAPEIADRFIRRFKQKIEEGLAVGR